MFFKNHHEKEKSKAIVSQRKPPFSHKGFTLIEIVLVVSLVGMTFGVASMNYFTAQRKVIYNNTIAEAMQFIKTARNYAISSRSILMNGESKVPAGGYGVHIDTGGERVRFTLFADIWNKALAKPVNVEEYQEIAGVWQKVYPDRIFTEGSDQVVDIFQFPQRVFLETIVLRDMDGNPVPSDQFHIIYEPPMAETVLSDTNGNTYLEAYLSVTNDYDDYETQESLEDDIPDNTQGGLQGKDSYTRPGEDTQGETPPLEPQPSKRKGKTIRIHKISGFPMLLDSNF